MRNVSLGWLCGMALVTAGHAYGATLISGFGPPGTIVTANGGSAAVSGGVLTVSPFQQNGEQAFITNTTGPSGGAFDTSFDMTINTHLAPTIRNQDGFDFFHVFSGGNNPVASLNLNESGFLNQYIIALGSGIEFGGGTVTSTGPSSMNFNPSALEGKTFHVDLMTTTTFNGGQNFTISNQAVFTTPSGPNFTLVLTEQGNSANAPPAYDPSNNPLVFSLGDTSFGQGLPPSDFTGNLQFANYQAVTTPEPASLTLLGVGALGLLAKRKTPTKVN